MTVDSGNSIVRCCAVCRQALLAVDRHVFRAIFKSDADFVYDLNSKLLVLFFVGTYLYKKGIVPIDCKLS